MWKVVLALLCSSALVSPVHASSAACASHAGVPDGGDDQCQLLQGGVGVVSNHKDAREGRHKGAGVGLGLVHHQQEDTKKSAPQRQHAKGSSFEEREAWILKDDAENKENLEMAKGLPDILKDLAASVGNTEEVKKDFEAIGAAAAQFLSEAHSAVEKLKADINGKESMAQIEEKVVTAYNAIHEAAVKVTESIKKTESDFLGGIAKAMPEQFKNELKKAVDHVLKQAQSFADAFKSAADELMPADHDASRRVCATVKKSLDHIKKEVENFATNAHGLSPDGLSKGLKEAIDKLPSTIKEEIDKLMDKAREAMEKISNFPKEIQELADGVAAAFGEHCSDLGAARHLELGLLSVLVVIMTTFSF